MKTWSIKLAELIDREEHRISGALFLRIIHGSSSCYRRADPDILEKRCRDEVPAFRDALEGDASCHIPTAAAAIDVAAGIVMPTLPIRPDSDDCRALTSDVARPEGARVSATRHVVLTLTRRTGRPKPQWQHGRHYHAKDRDRHTGCDCFVLGRL